jgi:Tol biopolymer transport system component
MLRTWVHVWVVLCLAVSVPISLAAVTERVSVSSAGEEGNGVSWSPSITADGRYVAFMSHASNLVPGDTNATPDAFVHDRLTGTTERVSVSSAGEEGNGASWVPSLSADGRYVAFPSAASNLVPGDTNATSDIFVHDRLTGTTERVSVSSAGEEGNGDSGWPSISADGRYVAFGSDASNLVPGDTNATPDIFVHDRLTGTTERVSVSSAGEEGNGGNWWPSISADGRYVAFLSDASNLVPGDTNGYDIFVHDRLTGTTERVSVSSAGEEGNGGNWWPSISADGRYVAFLSDASNLVPGDTNGYKDVFVHDRLTGTTERVSVSSAGEEGNGVSGYPSISADGRHVVFESDASNLVPGDTNAWTDIFVRHLGDVAVLEVGEAAASPGETATVPVSLTETAGVAGLQFDVTYNLGRAGLLGLMDVRRGAALPEDWVIEYSAPAADTVRVAAYSPTATGLLPGSGSVVELEFAVDPQATGGEQCTLHPHDIMLLDGLGQQIGPVVGQDGVFTAIDDRLPLDGGIVPVSLSGRTSLFAISVPGGIPNLFVTARYAGPGSHPSWPVSTLRLERDGVQVASTWGYRDLIIHLPGPSGGTYMLSVTAVGPWILEARSALPDLPLGQWVVGTIYGDDGSAWHQVTCPGGTASLHIASETIGLWSELRVYSDVMGGTQVAAATGSYYSPSELLQVEIVAPEPRTYYVHLMDSGYIYGGDQTRQYMIKADTVPIEPPPGATPAIASISPTTGGTAGPVTVAVKGYCFDQAATVCLQRDGYADVCATSVTASENGRSLAATFDLSVAEPGEWTLVVTNPDSQTATAPTPFTVEQGGEAKLWVEIVGREQLRASRASTLVLRLGNAGTTDSGPAVVVLEGKMDWQAQVGLLLTGEGTGVVDQWVRFGDKGLAFWVPNIAPASVHDISVKLLCNSVGDGALQAGFVSPKPPSPQPTGRQSSVRDATSAGESGWNFGRPGTQPPLGAIMFRRWAGWPFDPGHVAVYVGKDALGNDIVREIDCVAGMAWVQTVPLSSWDADHAGEYLGWATPPRFTESLGYKVATVAKAVPDGRLADYYLVPLWDTNSNCAKFVGDSYKGAGLDLGWSPFTVPALVYQQASGQPYPGGLQIWPSTVRPDTLLYFLGPYGLTLRLVDVIFSISPEDKYGPSGWDASGTPSDELQRWIPADRPIEYRIDFWNKEDASAATQDVIVTDQLDPDLDWSTFRFTEVGFLDWRVELEPCQYFNVDVEGVTIDLSQYYPGAPVVDLVVNCEGTFNSETGEIEWRFRALDPVTRDYPEEPLAGFLPPITDTGWEIGWVEFSVSAMPGLPSGTAISNQAWVTFDVNPPNPAPKQGPYVNTLDGAPPTSAVRPLDAEQRWPFFLVSFEGEDDADGCGLASYDLYVSEDGGAPYLYRWGVSPTDSAVVFTGRCGHGYAFYTRSRDHVGNLEPAPSGPDTSTVTGPGFSDIGEGFWAWNEIYWLAYHQISQGYPDGTYRPTLPVGRDQMAVYISRTLAGGEANVPTGPATATFPDVPTDHWAYKYVEYAVAEHIVAGYPDGKYQPDWQVNRGQMAVFVARAMADPSDRPDLSSYTPPATATFPDVPGDFWAYKFIEYIADPSRAVTRGYPDGKYHPEYVCTRDQMAVYMVRAFRLPL